MSFHEIQNPLGRQFIDFSMSWNRCFYSAIGPLFVIATFSIFPPAQRGHHPCQHNLLHVNIVHICVYFANVFLLPLL